jgi:hypothetical protein
MRHEKISLILQIARRLAGNSLGMTLEEIARDAGVDRRTAERMRDTLRDLFPTLLFALADELQQIIWNALAKPVDATLGMLPGTSHCKDHVYHPCVPNG